MHPIISLQQHIFSNKLSNNIIDSSEDAACLLLDILIFGHLESEVRILFKGHRIIVQVLVHITLICSAYLWPIDCVAMGRGGNLHNIS